jgi:agmatinase
VQEPFDPDAAAQPGQGIFGLPETDDAEVQLVPVPFDATTSYGGGAADGPAAILQASRQVDLFDLQTGHPWRRGIRMQPIDPAIRERSRQIRALVQPLIDQGGAGPADAGIVHRIDAAGAELNAWVGARTREILARGRLPGIVGGDHSVPYGAIEAALAAHPGLGILHVDAHADLRDAYEGFRWSHASIFHNLLHGLADLRRIVQVGIRDLGSREHEAIQAAGGRVVTHFDLDWRRRIARGEPLQALLAEAVAALPQDVWISFDVDGLDPAFCPHTGTPVPGGLQFTEACLLLEELVASGRRIVGFDLDEVAPGPDGDEWDANVGARLLYKLCGFALLTR